MARRCSPKTLTSASGECATTATKSPSTCFVDIKVVAKCSGAEEGSAEAGLAEAGLAEEGGSEAVRKSSPAPSSRRGAVRS
jgi:hypothetical protein